MNQLVSFYPLFFANDEFGSAPELMMAEAIVDFGGIQAERYNRQQDAQLNSQSASKSIFENSHQDTNSTRSTTLSTIVTIYDPLRGMNTKLRQPEQLSSQPNSESHNEALKELTLDQILDELLDSPWTCIMCPSSGCTCLALTRRNFQKGDAASCRADTKQFTVYSEPPSFLGIDALSEVFQKRLMANCLFLSQLHAHLNESTGSFVALHAPSSALKRKSSSLSRSSSHDLKAALLQETIDDVNIEREEVIRNVFNLNIRLKNAEAQLKVLRMEQHVQHQRHKQELQDLLLGYFPDQPVNYSHFLGPLRPDLVESATQIGPYSIDKCLGEGGFAQVFQCTYRTTKKKYAMKKLEKTKLLTPFALTSLSNELRVLGQVRHPNIISSKEFLNGTTHIYIVMELGHTSLYDYCFQHAGNLSLSVRREIAIGIFLGLEYLHSIGVAHLDLKLENILVISNVSTFHFMAKNICLADFGLCAIADDPMDDIRVDGRLGTPGFFAPEMKLVGFSEGRMADMWSAGVTLLELVEGLPKGWMDAYLQDDDDIFRAGLEDCIVLVVSDEAYFTNHVARDLVLSLMNWIPGNRPTCQEVLDHAFLKRSHLPVDAEDNCMRQCYYGNL